MPIPDALDQEIRTAAFIHVRRMLEIRDPLTSEGLARGFMFRGERIPLINPRRGIFKPQQMRYLLSIKTVVPSPSSRPRPDLPWWRRTPEPTSRAGLCSPST